MINQYRVFQIKEVHHQHWAKSYAQQVEDGFLIHHQNYQSAYKGKPAPSDTPMTARKRLEEKRPNTFIGRSFLFRFLRLILFLCRLLLFLGFQTAQDKPKKAKKKGMEL